MTQQPNDSELDKALDNLIDWILGHDDEELRNMDFRKAKREVLFTAESYANQLSEERVREAYRKGVNDALCNPADMTPEELSARNARIISSLNKPQIFGMPIKTDARVPENAIRFDHPDGRSEGFVLDKPQEKE